MQTVGRLGGRARVSANFSTSVSWLRSRCHGQCFEALENVDMRPLYEEIRLRRYHLDNNLHEIRMSVAELNKLSFWRA